MIKEEGAIRRDALERDYALTLTSDIAIVRSNELPAEVTRLSIAFPAGVLMGWTLALTLINHPACPMGARVLLPFAKLGFILGNPHRGSGTVTIVAVFLAFGLAGLATAGLAVFVVRIYRGRQALK